MMARFNGNGGVIMIKILIVDDHQLVRYGLKSLFKTTTDIEVIGDVGTGEEAIDFTKEHHPNVVLMDIRMPGIGGLEATRKIARSCPESRILVISSCDVEPFPSILLEVGATGFLSKGSSDAEMLTAVRAVASGVQYLSPKVAKAIKEREENGDNESPFNALSSKELQAALMLISGKKNKHIAESMYIDTKTVCSYRYRIYEKLHITTDVELALLAVHYGIIDDVPIYIDDDITPENNTGTDALTPKE
jgi:two-component system invasion response regulator UvrY